MGLAPATGGTGRSDVRDLRQGKSRTRAVQQVRRGIESQPVVTLVNTPPFTLVAPRLGTARGTSAWRNSAMSALELARYRQILEEKKTELVTELEKRDGLTIERSEDLSEEIQRAAERELAITNLERDSRLLRSVTAALLRMDDGTYGLCLECGETISSKRLSAVPWTPLCIACQDAADHRNGRAAIAVLWRNAA